MFVLVSCSTILLYIKRDDIYIYIKNKRSKISATPSVEIARLKLRECSIKYHSDATEDNRIAVQEGKQKL